eukprot:6185513-Pleurochrysis_carterae.AAC.4
MEPKCISKSGSGVIFVESVVLLYRLESAASPNNRRGGARPTMIMRLESLAAKCSKRARRLRSHVKVARPATLRCPPAPSGSLAQSPFSRKPFGGIRDL